MIVKSARHELPILKKKERENLDTQAGVLYSERNGKKTPSFSKAKQNTHCHWQNSKMANTLPYGAWALMIP